MRCYAASVAVAFVAAADVADAAADHPHQNFRASLGYIFINGVFVIFILIIFCIFFDEVLVFVSSFFFCFDDIVLGGRRFRACGAALRLREGKTATD